MDQLPLSAQVIFSDWHGVLSCDPFWASIRSNTSHPLHDQLEAAMAGVFDPSCNIASEWMKGLLCSDQVIAQMGIQLRGRFAEGFLARRLDLDCARMTVNTAPFEVLRVLRAEATVVIATDNMDCFARAFTRARARRKRAGRERETLADWAVVCDDIICSSETGMLKSEDAKAFFGPWLTAHGTGFASAVLIDDRADNCAALPTRCSPEAGTHHLGQPVNRPPRKLETGPARRQQPGPDQVTTEIAALIRTSARRCVQTYPASPSSPRRASQPKTGKDTCRTICAR